MWMDVDVALAEVPVNCVALIDDTDFKSREESVAYNAAGLELIWHFTTTAGVTTATVVTPTTGGDYDWTHQDGGLYTIEIPASGGVSINNDIEGFGYFSGIADGVLPWSGPIIGFRAAALNNLLIDNAYSATRGLAGTALPNAVAGANGGGPTVNASNKVAGVVAAVVTDTASRNASKATGFSTHNAAAVWAVGTRTLTSFGTLVADIWHKLLSGITTAGTIGKLIKDYLNAAITSRAAPGAEMNLANDTITKNKYNESDAFPVSSAMSKAGSTIAEGTVVADGGNSTTQFKTNLTEITNDHYKDLMIKFTSGNLKDQGTEISTYNGTTKIFTVVAMTETPAADDEFVIV